MSAEVPSSRLTARLRLASPADILRWSAGEVIRPDTLHPRSGKPVAGGLFCEDIFGPLHEWRCRCGRVAGESAQKRTCQTCLTPVLRRRGRRRRMGHIELAAPVAHIWFVKARPCPLALLLDLRPTDIERIVTQEAFLIVEGKRAGEVIATQGEGAETGATALELALRKIDLAKLDQELREQVDRIGHATDSPRRQKLLRRLRLVNTLRRSGVEPHDMILRRLPVIGPALRPIVRLESGRHASSELNTLYARVVAVNNRLREQMSRASTPAVLLRIEQAQLQLAVDALLDNRRCSRPLLGPRLRPLRSLSDLLGTKQGRFRGNMLGKRVDYSARSVIVVGPDLKLHEVGLPHVVALRLFEPLLLGQLRREGWAQTLRRGRALLNELLAPERLPELAREIVAELTRQRQVEHARGVSERATDAEVKQDARTTLDELDTAEARAQGRITLDELASSTIQKLRDALPRQGRVQMRERVHHLLLARQGHLWDLVRRVITGHPVLLNRAPTLHRMGIQAFEPVLIEGNAIRLHPLVCKAFNADFDGDQMAVHLPLSEEAITEAYERMTPARNLFNPASGQPIVAPGQDIVLGCYYLTALGEPAPVRGRSETHAPTPSRKRQKGEDLLPLTGAGSLTFGSLDEVRLAHDLGKLALHQRIHLRWHGTSVVEEADEQVPRPLKPGQRLDTTVGRALFNAILPAGLPFYNLTLTAKRLARVLADCHRKHGRTATVELLQRIQAAGFDAATRSGISFATDDIPRPRNKPEVLRDAFARVETLKRGYEEGSIAASDYPALLLETWDAAHKKITQTLLPDLRDDTRDGLNPLYAMTDSGARGSVEQIRQLAGLRGLMASLSGRVIERPITASLREGLPSWDYFVSAYGGRKGMTDKSVRTAEAGYLTRKLVDAAQQVIVTEADCGSLLGMLKRAPVGTLGGRVIGRVSLETVRNEKGELVLEIGELISPGQARRLAEMGQTALRVRSPIMCQSARGICQRCYGLDLASGKLVALGTAVGVIAAQSIGEPGTQLTLKMFHIGGVAGKDIVNDLERVTRLLEVSSVDDPVPLAPVTGLVHIARYRPHQSPASPHGWWLDDTGHDEILRLDGRELRVQPGDRIRAGTPLCEGEADLRKMLALGGSEVVADHLLENVRRIYRQHRLDIDDRHFEVILSRMLGSVVIRDPGDTDLLPGEVIARPSLLAINRALAPGKKPAFARTWLLGVSQAAGRGDGFLAAASFQRAVKVLAEAALAGRRDALVGLKENVILGRLIPAGTGWESGE